MLRTNDARPHRGHGRPYRGILAVAALIVTALTGCDNVEWGGASAAVVPPPPRGEEVPTGEVAERELAELPTGPLLYYVQQTDPGEAMLTPVAELAGDSLLPLRAEDPAAFGQRLIAERLRQGDEFTLFRRGARVGTFVIQDARIGEGECAQPTARGITELVPGVGSATEFLAMSRRVAPEARIGFDSLQYRPTSGVRRVAPILAERAIRARRAPLPGNWQRAMAQVQPFPLSNFGDPAFASTFLVDDTLGPGNDAEGYSLFFISVPRRDLTGYDTAYVSYVNYTEDGKAAPRVVDFLDWDQDDQAELLLEVYGQEGSWFEAVGASDGEWRRILRDRCEVDRSEIPVVADTTAPAGSAPMTPEQRAAEAGDQRPGVLGQPAQR